MQKSGIGVAMFAMLGFLFYAQREKFMGILS